MSEVDAVRARRELGSYAELFLQEAQEVPLSELADLKEVLSLYLKQVRRLQEENEFIDIELVERIGQAVRAMLALYPKQGSAARAAIVGAFRYFIIEEDEEGDLESIVGFDDDAEVVNWVIGAYQLDVPPVPIEG